MIATAVGYVFCPDRIVHLSGRMRLALAVIPVAGLFLGGRGISSAQTQDAPPVAAAPAVPAGSPSAPATPADTSGPIAFVPLDNNPDVKGAIEVSSGKAVIGKSGTVTSGSKTTLITLPRRGVLRVCASTSVHLSADASVPTNETPGLMMALDHGALEASFATG